MLQQNPVLYINGQYWGIYQTDERPEANFAESYYGEVPDGYDTVKVEGPAGYIIEATDGDLNAWRQLWDTSRIPSTAQVDIFTPANVEIGDTFTSTLVDPVYSSNGVVLAPQGSIVTGRVTHVQRAQKNGKPATMDVSFVSLKLPNGYVRQINGSLTEFTSSSGSGSDNEGTLTAKKTSHRKAKFIGGGAAGGAVIGAIAGGGKGLAIGAGVGALAGAIGGRVKKGSEVKVPSGTEFGVILNQATSLPRYGAAQ